MYLYSYKELQSFFCELQKMKLADTIFGRLGRLALIFYFKESGGRIRESPPDEDQLISEMVNFLIRHKKSRKPEPQLISIVAKSLETALEELKDRLTHWRRDEANGIRKCASFAYFKANWGDICLPLIKAGYITVRGVEATPDADLCLVNGIGTGKLTKIRRAIPARAKEEQPSLF